MLDTTTKKRIDDCRDILVGKLPDPKAQIEQITIALIYKFMDDMDKEAIELGGQAKFFSDYKIPNPEFPNDRTKNKTVEFSKYAWDRLMHPRVTAAEMLTLYSEAIEGMAKNPNIPQLFRDIFNNAYLPYRDAETLKLFLKTIGEFDYNHSENLGDAFEYLLSVMGSQGDAGQFRTPRHIIDFLVAVVNPDKTDSILDPACGTAGFLISAYRHILWKYSAETRYSASPQYHQSSPGDRLSPDDRRKLIHNFIGYDISPDMVRLSLVNLYLHGFSTPNINEYDTLSSEDRWNDTFDVILANPPFMSPKGGIRPHKRFTISSNRSEVLFVDYIAEHLNPNGKAGIIVPEGIIFQSGRAYKDLRKMLVENYLYAVVSLPAGVFNPYSGVKTSILLMDKKVAKQKEEILFVKIDNDGYNLGAQRTPIKGEQLSEAIQIIHDFRNSGTGAIHCVSTEDTEIAHLVPKAEIAKNGEYNLSGERYRNSLEVRNKNYEIVSLSNKEIFEVVSGGTPDTKNENFWNGNLNWATLVDLRAEDFISKITSTQRKITEEGLKNSSAKLLPINSILVSTRATIGRIAINSVECCTNQGFKNIIIRDPQKANSKFIALMMTKLADKMNSMATGGTFRELSASNFKTLQIPLPPISIQEEIVAEIEAYQKIIDGAKAVVENYKPHIDIDPDWEMVELGKYVSVDNGRVLTNFDEDAVQNVACIKVSDMNLLENQKEIVTSSHWIERSEYPTLPLGSVVFPKRGAAIATNKKRITRIPCLIDNNCMGITSLNSQVLLPDYLFFFMLGFDLRTISNSAGIALINNGDIKGVKIPLPDIKTQRRIVSQIEKEQELINANKQLIEIFEQKIKDRIAKVWGEKEEDNLSMAAEPQAEYGK